MIPLFAALALLVPTLPVRASDHGDMGSLTPLGRSDARITDLHAFTRGDKLVLAVCIDPTIPRTVTQYSFPRDLELKIAIDRDSPVRFDDPEELRVYGGTIVDPAAIREDVVFTIFFPNGRPQVRATGLAGGTSRLKVFGGLRDDPFIRGPRIGRNVGAVVIEVPLEDVARKQSTLLLWTTSQVPEMRKTSADLAGRSLRSMMAENNAMNQLHPREHFTRLGLRPDVMIYDTSRPAAFPNGRELADDVVDLVGDPRVLVDDAPFPSANDVPFLTAFPWLSPPHQP
jgi:hypothetical protein